MALNDSYPDYPIFKGLQKPLEFMGLQGRYIYWAAATAGIALLGFMAVYAVIGFIYGLIFLAAALSSGIILILVKQRKGLHTKKEDKGIFIYCHSEML